MKSLHKRILSVFAVVFLAFAVGITAFIQPQFTVFAAETNEVSFDNTAVMEDLEGTDLFAVRGEYTGDGLYVISFTEYCFAYDTKLNGNYGLYIYVYNPSAKTVVKDSTQHRIGLGVQYNGTEVTAYDKFNMRCLSVSDDGCFLKFKIVDKASEVTGETIISRVSESKLKRIYDISEIEVCHKYGEIANAYSIGKRYICTGFAKGYGQNLDGESTLDCFSEKATVVPLEVHATQYRPNGSNGKNLYTQDSLHSVYFTVPTEFVEKYGEMTAVHAQWLEALLKPILVTGNQGAYNAISSYLGTDLYGVEGNFRGGTIKDMGYMYFGGLTYEYDADGGYDQYWYGYSYNYPDTPTSSAFKKAYYGSVINPLYIMFNSGSADNSAGSFIPPSEGEGSLADKIQQATTKFGGELVEERYSRVLFERVDNEITDKKISSTDSFDIRNVDIVQTEWWQKILGGHTGAGSLDKETLDRYESVKGIQEVTESVMALSPEEICEKLKVGSHDYAAFRKYYDENKDKGTVYLFRYRISDYVSQQATAFEWSGSVWKKTDSNAYFFQTECDIGFDIIDITLTDERGEHVIGVAAKPIDVFPTPTPPLIFNEDGRPWWHYVVAFALLVLVVVLLYKLIKGGLSLIFKR